MVVLDAQTHFFHGVISEQPNQVVDRFRLISLFSHVFSLTARFPRTKVIRIVLVWDCVLELSGNELLRDNVFDMLPTVFWHVSWAGGTKADGRGCQTSCTRGFAFES